jgi:hypothetical protein
MAVTARQLWLILHIGLAALFLHSFAAGLFSLSFGGRLRGLAPRSCLMAAAAWLSVITGTYVVYPWYRAQPAAGADLTLYPQAYLEAHPELSRWHLFGMEWKEHVGWLAPFLATAVAYVAVRYGRQLAREGQIRRALLVLSIIAFFSALASGVIGVFLNKVAPNAFLAA